MKPSLPDWALIAFFAGVSLVLMLNHEPSFDESQPWLVARDAPDLGSIIRLMSYDGTLAMWYLILVPFARAGLPYFSMAALHFLTMFGAVFVFVRHAPFSRLHKALFVFGYFVLYEYNVVIRTYALSVLFLFLIASMYKERFKRPLSFSVLLFLMANSNIIFGLAVSVVLGGLYLFESFRADRGRVFSRGRSVAAFLVIALGFLAAAYQLWPVSGDVSPHYKRWHLDLSAKQLAIIPRIVVAAFLPIPQLKLNFLGTTLVAKEFLALGVPLFLLSLGFFIRNRKAMLIYLLSPIPLFGVCFLNYMCGTRHSGMLFMVFIFSLWISRECPEKPFIKSKLLYRPFTRDNLDRLLTALLFFQVVASAVAGYYDMSYDITASKKTGAFLNENGFVNNDTFIAASSINAMQILPYIPKPYSTFYFTELGEYRSYTLLNDETWAGLLSQTNITERVDKEIASKGYRGRVLLIMVQEQTTPEETAKKLDEKYKLIAYFNNTVLKQHSFFVYQLKKPDGQVN